MPVTDILTASTVIAAAVAEINKEDVYPSTVLTAAFSLQMLDNYQAEVLAEQKRWDFMQKFATIIGKTALGKWSVVAPTDLDDPTSNRGIWNFRISTQPNFTFVDKAKWDEITSQVSHSTLAHAINVGDLTVTLVSSADFPDGGTVQVGNNQYPYTANNRLTNVITLQSASTTSNLIGSDAWMGADFGCPIYWTIYNGYIYHWPIISAQFANMNYYLDYYTKQVQLTADTDELIIPDPTCASYYLQWKFLKKLNNGQDTQESVAAQTNYEARREKLKQKNSLGRTFRLKPLKNTINEGNVFGSDNKADRLRGWEV